MRWPLQQQFSKNDKKLNYNELSKEVESLSYRDKFRLAQLLIQLARKEEEEQKPEERPLFTTGKENASDLTEYVAERIKKLRPSKKSALLHSISAMFQFRGGISNQDIDVVVSELQKRRHIKIEANNRVSYPV
jgi:hypothetical protein